MPPRLPKPGLRTIDGILLYLEHAGPNLATLTPVDKVLSSELTDAGQLVEVVEFPFYGKSLYIEHIVMLSLYDEFIYHETLIHPALLTVERPEKVLIIGGGDGGALREVLKHPVSEVTMVELDRSVIDLVRKHLPEVPAGAFEDERLKLVIGDGRAFIENTDERFDVVVLDLTDPYGQAARLYTKEFYGMVRRILRDGGLMVTHSTGLHINRRAFQRVYRAIKEVFPKYAVARTFIPSFTDDWTFSFGSDYAVPSEIDPGVLRRRYEERGLKGKTKFYSPEMHHSLFQHPVFVINILEEDVEPSTDSNPAEIKE
ncbi:MAG TPA: polyamine aminopropyltransferase [Candidatus Korarchaeota archaeon]|nr:polyamine aminopropyltransferase [Candidatus Korarchaeota archaeon]